MDRMFNRRALLTGTSALALLPTVPTVDAADATPQGATEPAAPQRISAFLIGTRPKALGVSLEIFSSGNIASIDVHPMMFSSYAGCVESTDPAVCAFLSELVTRIKAEAERTAAASAHFLLSERAPSVSGEWIECPDCHGMIGESADCPTCWNRGAVWNNFEAAS